MNKKLLLGIIAGICVVALVLGLVLGLSNCAGTEPTEPTGSAAPSGKPTDPDEPETEPEYIPEVEGGISYYSGKPDYSWYDPTVSTAEYTLYTADQLYGLVELVNTMSMTFEGATIKLANNMVINEGDASKWGVDEFMIPWVPIGKGWTSAFAGTIDGQDHYISGLYSVQPKNNGFICYSQGATIKNLAIVNSYFCNTNEDDVQAEVMATFVGRGRGVTLQNLYSDAILVGGGYSTGGIVGYTQSSWDKVTKDCLVESCVFAGQIKNASGKGTGGILGHDNGSKYSVTVKNCLFIGTLDSKNTNCGGIVGALSGESQLINCVSAGKVTSTSEGFSGVALLGSAGSNCTVSNNYYVSTKSGKAIGTGSPATEEGNMGLVRATMKGLDVAKVMTKLDFVNSWTALEDTYPIPTGVKALYELVKKPLTEDTSDDSDKASSGSQSGGTASVGDVDTSWYSEDKDSFTLTTVKQLYGLAQLVNEGNDFSGKTVKLGKDLVVNSGSASKWTKDTTGLKAWVPIGSTSSKQFKGTFDGQGHYISGIFSVQAKDNGLFGYAKDATVKNLAVINSFFENTGATSASTRSAGQRLSAFVATGENVKLSGLYSDAVLKNAGTDLGGIIGYAKGETTVDSCAFAGTILSDGFERRNYGGIVGYNERGVLTVSNCLFSGKMDTKTHLQGGIVGRSNINGTTIKNCVSVGEVKSSHSSSANSNNAIIGAVKAELESTTVTVENCYYLNGSKTVNFLENVGENVANVKETNVVKLDEAAAKGENVASAMTKLDFKSKWSALKDDYPIPTAVKAVYVATHKVHTHAWATAWTSNSSHHWHECTADECDVTANADKNGYGEHVYTDAQDDTCNTCNYKRTIVQDDGKPSVYSGTPNTDWYNDEDTVFVLTTADQLYGFAELVNEGNDFSGKTVKLGKDMVINEGDASTWGTTAPSHKWTPIAAASAARFRGTFDGQGKYISGIYSYQEINNGLFVYLEGGSVLNVAVINSYFENYGVASNKDNSEVLSSVVGRIYDAGTVKNVYSNAYVVTSGRDWHTGGIIGWARSSKDTVPTIDSCIFAGTIITNAGNYTGENVGGIIGGNDSNSKVVEISNCLMIGHIHSNDKSVGGIIGALRGNNTKLVDCVVATEVKYTGDGDNRGAVVGNLNTDKGQLVVENCYYVAETGTNPYGNVVDASKVTLNGNAAITAAQLKLQASFPGLDFTSTWTQTAEVPVPTALKAVYEANKAQHVCEFETEWTYDSENHWHACSDINCDEIKDKASHDFGTDGLGEKCSVCNAPNPNSGNTGTPDTSWYDPDSTEKVGYIMTEDQLLGLAKLVDAGTCNFKGWTIYLGADLVMNEGDASTWDKSSGETLGLINWTPIGENYDAKGFQGTFDGLGHTISGIYSVQNKNNALFSHTRNAVIKNLSVVNSYFENLNDPAGWGNENMATFVGRGQGLQVYNLYSEAILVHGGPNTGGIVGYTQNGGVTGVTLNDCVIESCVFAGQIRNHTTTNAGGILGSDNKKDYSVTVKDCLFTGSIESTGVNVGGLVGTFYGASTLDGSVSNGTVTNTQDGWSNVALVGSVSSSAKITNNRYQNVENVKKFGTGTPAVDENNVGIGPVIIGAAKPTISTQPIGSAYEPNDAAVALEVVASVTDNGTLTYQWYKSTTSATDGFTAIDGATEATYTPSLDEDAWYRCEVTNTNLYVSGSKTASVISDAVKVHVHSWGAEWDNDSINHFHSCSGCDDVKDKAKHASTDNDDVCDTCGQTIVLAAEPQIGGQPAGPLNGANVDDDVDLVVNNATASDGGTLTYQWYSNTTNSTENGTAIEGETGNSYTFTPGAPGVYYFYCVVTNTNSVEQVNEKVSDVAVVHVHGWKTEWVNTDANNHWHECSTENCPITDNTAKNGYGAHSLVHNVCETCDYVGPVSYYDAALGNDISWYLADKTATSYRLTNVNQLFGLAALVNGETGDASISGPLKFEDVKFTLACNMVINQGDAATWGEDTTGLVSWTPIGTWTSGGWKHIFRGTLDGDYHYISGIYCVRSKDCNLINCTQGAVVENLAIVNSYFHGTGEGISNNTSEVVAAFVGRGNGITLRNLYTDARIVSTGEDWQNGGICSYAHGDATYGIATIDSCVFAGSIESEGKARNGRVGGILGGTNDTANTVKITNCLMIGTISSDDKNVGGITGSFSGNGSQITDCVVASPSANITTTGTNFGAIVGQLGKNTTTSYSNMAVADCYYLGTYTNVIGAQVGVSVTPSCTSIADAAALKVQGNFSGLAFGENGWYMDTDHPIPDGVKDMYASLKTILVATTPTINAEPQGAQYNVGADTAALTVEATGDATGVLSYQWYRSTTSATTGYTPITGATGNSYTPDTSASGNTWYYCLVTNTNSINGKTNNKSSGSALVHVHDWDETKYASNEEYHWNTDCQVANCTETDPANMGSYEQHTTFGNHICSECAYVGAVSYLDATTDFDPNAENIQHGDTSWYVGHENDSTYTLKTANQLYGLADLVNSGVTFEGKTIYLGVNMVINTGDASTWTASTTGLVSWTPIGTGPWGENKYFAGTLDGNGHYISGIFSYRQNNNALIAYAWGAKVQNLAVINSYFENYGDATGNPTNGEILATFVGRGRHSSMSNLYSDAVLRGGYVVGGICAYTDRIVDNVDVECTIDSCMFAGDIYTSLAKTSGVGGILGHSNGESVTITNCQFSGKISGNLQSFGGIVGRLYSADSKIENCVSVGQQSTTNSWNSKKCEKAAIIGHMKGFTITVKNCYYLDGMNAVGVLEANGSTAAVCNTNGGGATATTGLDALSTMTGLTNWTATTGYPVPTGASELYSEKALLKSFLDAQN